MKLGVILPTFRDSAEDAFRAAALADERGLDGVFAFDHLWPIGDRERPALAPFPLLAAVAASLLERDGGSLGGARGARLDQRNSWSSSRR